MAGPKGSESPDSGSGSSANASAPSQGAPDIVEKVRPLLARGDLKPALAEINEFLRGSYGLHPKDSSYHYLKAQILYKAGGKVIEWEQALKAIEDAIIINPRELLDVLTNERVSALKPDDPAYHCVKGIALRMLGDLPQALESFERALKLISASPGSSKLEAECRYWKGSTLIELGRRDEALAELKTLVDLADRMASYDFEYQAYKAWALWGLGRYEEALEELNKTQLLETFRWDAARLIAIKLVNLINGARYHYFRGLILDSLGRYEGALEELNEAIRMDSNNPEYYLYRRKVLAKISRYVKAETYIKEGRCDEAARELQIVPPEVKLMTYESNTHMKAILATLSRSKDPSAVVTGVHPLRVAEFLYDKAHVLMALGRYGEAINDLDLALRIAPNALELHHLRAIALVRVGNYEDALKEYDRLINIYTLSGGPENVSLWYYRERGDLLFAMGEYEKAMKDYEYAVRESDRAIERDPKNEPIYRSFKGTTLMKLGSREEAVAELEKAVAGFDRLISFNPYRSDNYGSKGLALLALNRLDEAINEFDRALNTGISSPILGIETTILIAKGTALLGKGDYRGALNEFMCAYKLDSDNKRLADLALALLAASCTEGPKSAVALLKRENVSEQAVCGAMRELTVLRWHTYGPILPACARSFLDQFMKSSCGGRPRTEGATGGAQPAEPKRRHFLFWRH